MKDESQSRIASEGRPLSGLSDHDLLARLTAVLAQSRRVESDLIAHIAEVDARRLFAREAFPSMFAYCTDALHLSESEAYLRIAVARASREHPMILPMLGDGRLHLSGIALLAPHLTRENRETLLRRASHRPKREVEELVAELAPQPDAATFLRKLPDRRPGPQPTPRTPSGMGRTVTWGVPSPLDVPVPALSARALPPPLPVQPAPVQPFLVHPHPRPAIQPLAPGRYKVQFTASAALQRKLVRLRALMRPQVPDGDLGAIIEAAVSEKLERLEARRFGATRRPRKALSKADTSPSARQIPAPVRRAVLERDGGQCRYVDAAGRRCKERDRLEYHHRRPFALGGDHRPENIGLMCPTHNAYLAEHDYGRVAMARFSRALKQAAAPVGVASARIRAGPEPAGPPGS